MIAGLSDLFDVTAHLEVPDPGGQPWLSIKYGDDPDQVFGVMRAQVGGQSVIVKVDLRMGIGQTLIPWIVERRGVAGAAGVVPFAAAAESSDAAGRRRPARPTSCPPCWVCRRNSGASKPTVGRTACWTTWATLGPEPGWDQPVARASGWKGELAPPARIRTATTRPSTTLRRSSGRVPRTVLADSDLWRAPPDQCGRPVPQRPRSAALARPTARNRRRHSQ